MSSEWRPVLNDNLTDVEVKTITTLGKINDLLLHSGQHLDEKIKDYFKKSLKNR